MDRRPCLLPSTARGADLICILHGGRTPFVLRKRPGDDESRPFYSLVGECLVDRAMNGEIEDSYEQAGIPSTTFALI